MARRCIRKKTITVLQKYGPAKKVRVCAKFGTGRKARKSRRKATRRKGRWCVFKGKRAVVATSCHSNKRAAKHAAAVLRKTCRSRIRVKRSRAK